MIARSAPNAAQSVAGCNSNRHGETSPSSTEGEESFGQQTRVIHASRSLNRTRAVTSPIWQTTSFEAASSAEFARVARTTQPSEYYTRYGNPTHEQVEATLMALEGGEAAMLTSSGMGSIFTAAMSFLQSGDHVLAQRSLYASATTLFETLLPRWGIECSFVEQTNPGAFVDAIQPNTKLIYVESPANPLMRITDLRSIAELGRKHGVITMIDNTLATPINQRPLEFGIDVVVHSATKYLSGHHDVTAGAIIGSREFITRAWDFRIVDGAVLGPFDAWLLLRGLRTLPLRVERHNQNAFRLATFLETHPKVERVNYPGLLSHPQHDLARAQMSGFTGMLSVEFKGNFADTERLIQSLRLGAYAASLGGYETLLVHPAAMWAHALSADQRGAMELGDTLVRISVGLEDVADLIADFAKALEAHE